MAREITRTSEKVMQTCAFFFGYNHTANFETVDARMAKWIREGKLRALVDISDGFEKMPAALMALYTGSNRGKGLVRVNPGEDIIF